MQKAQEFDGYWNLAGSDASVPGSLTFTPEDGVRLSLNGAFDTGDLFGMDDSYRTLHGVTHANKKVTLAKCLQRTSTFAAGYAIAEYTSSVMVIGRHFPCYEQMTLREMSISYFNLEEIVGISGIKEELAFSRTGNDVKLGYKKPSMLSVPLGDFTVSAAHRWGVDGNHFQERRIWQQAWLTATSERERHLDDFFGGPFRSLHTLLELAADSVLPIEAITGKAEGEGTEGEMEIFIQPPRHVTEPKRRHPAELLFTLHGLGDRFADCLQRWDAGRVSGIYLLVGAPATPPMKSSLEQSVLRC